MVDETADSARRMLHWAGGILIVLGVGHLALLVLLDWRIIESWFSSGIWAAVPLELSGTPGVAELQNAVTFWAGPGSFSVSTALVGWLVIHLARRRMPVPAGIGWVVAVWFATIGTLLVPSPGYLGVVAGVLIILAARRQRIPERPRPVPSAT